jgi:hypothetical protein
VDNKFKNLKRENKKENLFAICQREDTVEGRIKYASSFLSKEINKSYHPFGLLCKRFSDIFSAYLQNEEAPNLSKSNIQNAIKDFSDFLINGCIQLYMRWGIDYLQIEEQKWNRVVHPIVINEIWAVNDGYLLHVILKTIEKCTPPLKIDFNSLSKCSSLGIIKP